MQKKRHDSRKTSYWSNSDCSVHGRYRQRYPMVRVRVFNNFVINVDIEPPSRLPSLRHQMTSDWRVFEHAKEATDLIGQTVIFPYMEYTDSGILRLGFVFNNFVINVDIEPSSRLPSLWYQMHPNGVFSNVLMQKKRHGSRKTNELSKSDCSVYERCRQRYLVYYES